MGGGSGGFIGHINIENIRKAAVERIRLAMGGGASVLFAAPDQCHSEIIKRIEATESFENLKYQISGLDEADISRYLGYFKLAVIYIAGESQNKEMSSAADFLFENKKAVIAVQSLNSEFVPTFVQAYRVKIYSWEELKDLIVT